MHPLISFYYFTWQLLRVLANVSHPQGARLYLLSYIPIWVYFDKIPYSQWVCVCYVAEIGAKQFR
jgi:hypothetical protein